MFSQNIALVTGAGSGIGLATSRLFIEQGLEVFGLDVCAESLSKCSQQLGPRFHELQCDVADEHQVDEARHFVAARCDKLDYLVNNAGFSCNAELTALDVEELDRICDTKIKGAMLLVQHFFRLLDLSDVPSIVNVASAESEVVISKRSFLAGSTNAALENFTRSLVRGFPRFRSNTVSPGLVETLYLENMFAVEDSQPSLARLMERVPPGRTGKPEEVARVIAFLCSEQASYINGANILVDGGLSCQIA